MDMEKLPPRVAATFLGSDAVVLPGPERERPDREFCCKPTSEQRLAIRAALWTLSPSYTMICGNPEWGRDMDVVVWLRNLGLGKYEAAFRENEIDETVLPSLTHETLKELGLVLSFLVRSF
jgi:hypothetical protein